MCECSEIVLLSIPRAAKIMSVDPELVRGWVRQGLLPKANTPDLKQVRIRKCDLRDFLIPKERKTAEVLGS